MSNLFPHSQNIDASHNIKAATLQISGLFMRMRMGQYPQDKGFEELAKLTNQIDKFADNLEAANRKLRQQNALLATDKYRFNLQMDNLKKQKEETDEKLKLSQESLCAFDFFTQDAPQEKAQEDTPMGKATQEDIPCVKDEVSASTSKDNGACSADTSLVQENTHYLSTTSEQRNA